MVVIVSFRFGYYYFFVALAHTPLPNTHLLPELESLHVHVVAAGSVGALSEESCEVRDGVTNLNEGTIMFG